MVSSELFTTLWDWYIWQPIRKLWLWWPCLNHSWTNYVMLSGGLHRGSGGRSWPVTNQFISLYFINPMKNPHFHRYQLLVVFSIAGMWAHAWKAVCSVIQCTRLLAGQCSDVSYALAKWFIKCVICACFIYMGYEHIWKCTQYYQVAHFPSLHKHDLASVQ